MRILVVDDEMVSRTKLETIMSSSGLCRTAESGKRALDLYARALADGKGYDLVMLDIDMPDLQGDQVLKRFREMEYGGPHRAAVVMVTAKSDQAHVMECLNSGCDAYIAKPFNERVIKEKLSRLGLVENRIHCTSPAAETAGLEADALYREIENAVQSGRFKLPAMPQTGIRFRRLVDNKADVSEMARLLKQDAVLSEKLVEIANSMLCRGFDTVQTVELAIGRLGLTQTEQMVAALSFYQLSRTGNRKYADLRQSLWMHSLASAYAAEMLARSLARGLSVDAFRAGLLHDVGMLALLHMIAQMEGHGRFTEAINDETLTVIIKRYHAIFGAKLLQMWHLDDEYSRIALSHNNLHTAESLTDELLVVHFGNLVAKCIGYTADGRPYGTDLVAGLSAKKLKLDAVQINSLNQKVTERMKLSASLMN